MARRNKVLELVPPSSASPKNPRGPKLLPEVVYKGEDPAAWETFLQTWMDDYRPADFALEFLVRQLAESAWELRRAEREFRDLERDLRRQHGNLLASSDEDKESLQYLTRARIRAEQSFQRARSAAEQMRRSRRLEASQQQRLERPRKEAPSTAQVPKSHESATKRPVHDEPAPFMQSVHIEVRDGITRTILNPENEFLHAMIRQLGQDGQPVHRTIHFPDRIPPEYIWATFGKETAPSRVRWILSQQRFEQEMTREKENGTGHLVPDRDQYTRETILLG